MTNQQRNPAAWTAYQLYLPEEQEGMILALRRAKSDVRAMTFDLADDRPGETMEVRGLRFRRDLGRLRQGDSRKGVRGRHPEPARFPTHLLFDRSCGKIDAWRGIAPDWAKRLSLWGDDARGTVGPTEALCGRRGIRSAPGGVDHRQPLAARLPRHLDPGLPDRAGSVAGSQPDGRTRIPRRDLRAGILGRDGHGG